MPHAMEILWVRRSSRVLLSLVAAILLASSLSAEDTRPTELPYDTPGEFPTLDPSYRQTSQ